MGRHCRGDCYGNRSEHGHTAGGNMRFGSHNARPGAHLGPAFGLGVALALLALTGAARAEAEPSCAETKPWSRLGTTAENFARPVPLALTWFAVLSPLSLSPTGADHQLRLVAQRDAFGKPRLEPVSVWTPYVLGTGLLIGYTVSLATGSCSTQRVLAPILQAGVMTYGVVGLLKIGVGRQWPNGGSDPNAPDRLEQPERAQDFAPFQRGIGAWPSGHTAVMFAGAAAFRAGNPELGWLSASRAACGSVIITGRRTSCRVRCSARPSVAASARAFPRRWACPARSWCRRSAQAASPPSGPRCGDAKTSAQTITKSSVSAAS